MKMRRKNKSIFWVMFSVKFYIFLWALALFLTGFNRVNLAIHSINSYDDYYIFHFGNVGIMYLYLGVLILIGLLIGQYLEKCILEKRLRRGR